MLNFGLFFNIVEKEFSPISNFIQNGFDQLNNWAEGNSKKLSLMDNLEDEMVASVSNVQTHTFK